MSKDGREENKKITETYLNHLVVGEAFQGTSVHAEDLVAPLQFAVGGGGTFREHGFHKNRQVTVWGARPTDDGEAEPTRF